MRGGGKGREALFFSDSSRSNLKEKGQNCRYVSVRAVILTERRQLNWPSKPGAPAGRERTATEDGRCARPPGARRSSPPARSPLVAERPVGLGGRSLGQAFVNSTSVRRVLRETTQAHRKPEEAFSRLPVFGGSLRGCLAPPPRRARTPPRPASLAALFCCSASHVLPAAPGGSNPGRPSPAQSRV